MLTTHGKMKTRMKKQAARWVSPSVAVTQAASLGELAAIINRGEATQRESLVLMAPLQFEIIIRLTISAVSDLLGARFHEVFAHWRRGHSTPSELGNERLQCCWC